VGGLFGFGVCCGAAGQPGSVPKSSLALWTAEINKRLDAELESLEKLYKVLHANPELSFEEERTAARMAHELKALGFEVTTGVGGHGVVGVLKNGKGPTVLVRTDMDALPVTEKTGVAYASKVRVRDKEGKDVGVMHACGHDMHMTCWTGTARVLAGMKDQWHGTLVFIGQPAEEVGGGARRMLEAGLFKRFPRPDYCLGLHCDGRHAYGHVSYSTGLMMANVDRSTSPCAARAATARRRTRRLIPSCWQRGSCWICKRSSAARSARRTRRW